MSEERGVCGVCPNERVRKIEHRILRDRIEELKDRVQQIERTLARGMLLLVANLAGMVVSLARAFVVG